MSARLWARQVGLTEKLEKPTPAAIRVALVEALAIIECDLPADAVQWHTFTHDVVVVALPAINNDYGYVIRTRVIWNDDGR